MAVSIREPRVVRSSGRRTAVEEAVTNTLIGNAKTMQQWLINNNRIATGTAVNSLSVHIVRQPKPGRTFRKGRSLAKTLGHKTSPAAEKEIATLNTKLDLLDIGYVKGEIRAVPHFRFALEGRGPGKMPPVSEIEKWMMAKEVQPIYKIRSSAYVIARKIAREGTNPPHWDTPIATTMAKYSTKKLLRALQGPMTEVLGKELVARILSVADGKYFEAFYRERGGNTFEQDLEILKQEVTQALRQKAERAFWTSIDNIVYGKKE